MDTDKPFEGPAGRMSGLITNMLLHYNHITGEEKTWWVGPQELMQEPCFVARAGSVKEGDGYILTVSDNQVTNYSDLLILHALDIENGPIARIKLPFRLRFGLHGTWADANKVLWY